MNNLTDSVYYKITDEYLIPLILTIQINKMVNDAEYLQWQQNVNEIIDVTNTNQINKTTKVNYENLNNLFFSNE